MTDLQARPLRVCHLVATTLGATWMFEQLRELRDGHGYEVSAVVNAAEGPLVDLLRSERIPFHVCDFGLQGRSRAWAMLTSIVSLARFLRAERYDVVQTHVFLSTLVARPAAWIAGVPVRLAMIAGPFHLEAKASLLVERMTHWMDTGLVPSCEKSRRLCLAAGIPEERVRLIYYSADTVNRFTSAERPPGSVRREFGWPENTPVIALVAYFYPRLGDGAWIPKSLHGKAVKGHEDLIRAAPLVLQEFPNARFLLVGGAFAGQTQYLDEMKALVKEAHLENCVVFTGHRSDIGAILGDVDIAVQASLCENLGGSLEALAMARPMVATRVGGLVDAVRDGETGLLAAPRDPRDIARCLRELLRDPERASAMGERGRALVRERFSLQRTVADLDVLYQEQLAAERGRAYRVSALIRRVVFGLPWLAFAWVRAHLQDDGPWWKAVPRLAGRAAVRVLMTIRRRVAILKAVALEGIFSAWVALAPAPVRRIARRLRLHFARPEPS